MTASALELSFTEWPLDVAATVPAGFEACALIDPDRCVVSYRPGLPDEVLQQLFVWGLVAANRFVEHGPEPDGWQTRSDGMGQRWLRPTRLPNHDLIWVGEPGPELLDLA